MPVIVALVLLAQLGAPFDDPNATATPASNDQIAVDIEVAVEALNVVSVVAHVVEPGGTQSTTSLNARGDLRYGAVVTLPRADHVVVFEAVSTSDSVLSQPVTLTEIGLDPAVLTGPGFAVAEPDLEPASDGGASRWGWAAVAFGAASLAMLALWAAGPRAASAPDDPSRAVDDEVPAGATAEDSPPVAETDED